MPLNYNMLPKVHLDFTKISTLADRLEKADNFSDAIRAYLCLCDGDPSLEGGYFANRLSVCYEKLGEFFAAKYWAGRAVEENPGIDQYSVQRAKFENVTILDIFELAKIIR
jgi:hypothetical protein